MKEQFSKRCLKYKIPEETSKEVYSMIEKFASYGFNKSHSACYARIAYETAYLKAHFPVEFMTANMTIDANNKDKLVLDIMEARDMHINILPPDISKSDEIFTVEGYTVNKQRKMGIRYGIGGIDRLTGDVARSISHDNSKTFFDFVNNHPEVRKNQVENLIYSGAFDKFGSRKEMVEIYPSLKDFIKKKKEIMDIFHTSILELVEGEDRYNGYEYSLMEKTQKEREVINISLSGHVLDSVRLLKKEYREMDKLPQIQQMDNHAQVSFLGVISDIKEIMTKKNKPMAFVSVEDEFKSVEGVIFPTVYADLKDLLEIGTPFIISGAVSIDNEGEDNEKHSIIVNAVERAIEYNYRLYINKADLKNPVLQKSIKAHNGICEVISIDSKDGVKQENFFVNHQPVVETLKKENIPYILNNQYND